MKEQLISLPTAILAKEKGYNWESIWMYTPDGEMQNLIGISSYQLENKHKWLYAPSQSLLQRWLREKHGIHIGIRRMVWNGQIEYNDFVYPSGSEKHTDTTLGNEFDTFEDALENALQEALKLI